MKTGVLLINLGTPDSPSVSNVRKYLYQFLNDSRVIDLPWLQRKLLVNLIIVPLRAPKSAKLYSKLWTEKGSPLLYYGKSVKEKLQTELGKDYIVELGMRYQNPSLPSALKLFEKQTIDKLVVLPMFPHYASSSTGSAVEEVMKYISKWNVIPDIKIINQFYNADGYLSCFAKKGRVHMKNGYDHVLFSFHGLPVRHLESSHKQHTCADCNCERSFNPNELYCYKNTCYETARKIAEKMQLTKNQYSVSFQSRLGKEPWIQPFSDIVVAEKAKEGIKRLLVFSPAFIADCLETTIEIGSEFREIFEQNGGKHLQLVESLNDDPDWIVTIKQLVELEPI